jgi:hypothetical protein
MSAMPTAHLILYVRDQEVSTRFYAAALDAAPRLNVPGMTEFDLGGTTVLGLMPEAGIRRLLGAAWPGGHGESKAPPRAELYLHVSDVAGSHGAPWQPAPPSRARQPRSWVLVAYLLTRPPRAGLCPNSAMSATRHAPSPHCTPHGWCCAK